MQKQHNTIEFLCFTAPEYSRVVKVEMQDLHKIEQGYQRIGDPVFMSSKNTITPITKALEVYNKFSKRKLKEFKNEKDSQVKLWNLLYKLAIKPEEMDLKRSYQTTKEITKPNNYCNEVSARDPYDTSQEIRRTDKMPMSTKNKERMKQYNKIKTIQDVLDQGILEINDIKYDIKLGYIKII
tara:strand:+ start:668 stop:1213 length:546 start_codon:yes stop_codon:yes gene_type:complete